MAGVNIVRVPYSGGGPAITALVGGEVQLAFGTAVAVAPHVKSGRLRALAVTSAKPTALAPGLPTLAASGLPGYEIVAVDFALAPAGTPSAVIRRLNQEIVRLLNQPDVKEKILNSGEEADPSSPEELAASMKSEMIKVAKLIKDAGIKAD
jgi:tripartite-type tricarboxylate transporter receptor subunit TctC